MLRSNRKALTETSNRHVGFKDGPLHGNVEDMAFCGGDWTLALSDYDKPCRLLPMGTMSIAAALSQNTGAGIRMHYPQVSSLFWPVNIVEAVFWPSCATY